MAIPYKIQTIWAVIFGTLLYYGYNESSDPIVNVKRGLTAAVLVLLAQGAMGQYVGPFTKGYEWVFRLLGRYAIVYMAFLIFILYQNPDDARHLLSYIDPTFGKKPEPKLWVTYEHECDLTLENLWGDIDHYYAMHLFGWFFSSLLIRDTLILHFWSVYDEILELSWQHILPHFGECWWDHIITDLTLSNTPGIHFGMWFIRKTGLREFDWLGRKGKKSITEWDIFHNHRRYSCFCALLVIISCNFLTGFFMINVLWIPPKVNIFNLYRLTVWFTMGSMAIGELHDDIETWGSEQRRKTPISNEYRWICCAVMLLESTISYKFRFNTQFLLDVETPLYKTIPWIVVVSAILLGYIKLRIENKVTKYGDSPRELKEKGKQAAVENGPKKQAKESNGEKPKEEAKPKKAQQVETKVAAPVQKEEPVVSPQKLSRKAQQKLDEENAKLTQAGKQAKKKVEEAVEEVKEVFVPKPVEEEWHTVAGPKFVKKSKRSKRE